MDKGQNSGDKAHQTRAICLHAFWDLTRLCPLVFVFLLKECYVHGTYKATLKYCALQEQVLLVLHNSPVPGPTTFIVRCLYIVPILGNPYTQGISQLLLSALRQLQTIQNFPITPEDLSEARSLAARLFLDCIAGPVIYEEGILIKLLTVVDIGLKNIGEALCGLEFDDDNLDIAKKYIEPYILRTIESYSYTFAVGLLERFSIRNSDQSFLARMMQVNQFTAAHKWATFMGKSMLCLMVQQYIDMKMLKNAYEAIKENNLQQEFPNVLLQCKENSLKKLVEKGCWDIAEAKTHNDRQLIEYLVYLALEAGYSEKVDELCQRYSLSGFIKPTEALPKAKANPSTTCYLQLNELLSEDINWVDEIDCLLSATSHIASCKVIGIDCEWKANYEKGSKPNKVSIMQIASEEAVFIFDLIKLTKEIPEALDSCLKQIFHSSSILKLGYNLQCDLHQLTHSYGELGCFNHYEMLLDIQNVFREPCGGLSGLSKKILGAGLDKTKQLCNWEERPLSQIQLEYAALDAVVLIHIFRHVRNQSYQSGVNDKVEWKSNIIPHLDGYEKKKKKKKKSKSKSKSKLKSKREVEDDESDIMGSKSN